MQGAERSSRQGVPSWLLEDARASLKCPLPAPPAGCSRKRESGRPIPPRLTPLALSRRLVVVVNTPTPPARSLLARGGYGPGTVAARLLGESNQVGRSYHILFWRRRLRLLSICKTPHYVPAAQRCCSAQRATQHLGQGVYLQQEYRPRPKICQTQVLCANQAKNSSVPPTARSTQATRAFILGGICRRRAHMSGRPSSSQRARSAPRAPPPPAASPRRSASPPSQARKPPAACRRGLAQRATSSAAGSARNPPPLRDSCPAVVEPTAQESTQGELTGPQAQGRCSSRPAPRASEGGAGLREGPARARRALSRATTPVGRWLRPPIWSCP